MDLTKHSPPTEVALLFDIVLVKLINKFPFISTDK